MMAGQDPRIKGGRIHHGCSSLAVERFWSTICRNLVAFQGFKLIIMVRNYKAWGILMFANPASSSN